MNILVIAGNTYREGIRRKILIGFMLASLLVIGSSVFLSAAFTSGEPVTMVKNICLTSVVIFGMLIAVFTAGSCVPSEIENRVIHTVISKPISRLEYLLGKFLGVQLIVLLNIVTMTVLFLGILYTREHIISLVMIKAVVLTYFELLLVSSYTLAISTLATSSTLPIICGFFVYITGSSVSYLKQLAENAASSGSVFQATIMKGLYEILPNLSQFGIRNEVLTSQPNDPNITRRALMICGYGLAHALIALALAYIIVWRKREV
ncbi:ABC transporter permease [Candidatus Hydrogenedentota bacterium]